MEEDGGHDPFSGLEIVCRTRRNTLLASHNGSRFLASATTSRTSSCVVDGEAGPPSSLFKGKQPLGAYVHGIRAPGLTFYLFQKLLPVFFVLLAPFFLLRVVSFPPPIVPVGSLSFTLLHKKLL